MLSNQHEKKVVTRFPPSPTGFLHIGRVRTLLFNYFFTKQNNGKMIFRLEDTDKTRSKKEYENDIIENLRWLGVEYDEGPFRQSERTDIYKKYLKRHIHDTETNSYPGSHRSANAHIRSHTSHTVRGPRKTFRPARSRLSH